MKQELRQLIDRYRTGVGPLRELVTGLGPDELRARPVAGKWSTLEVVAHLADSEALFTERIKRVLSEERPTLLYADESKWVAALAANDRDLETELALMELTRKQLTQILETKNDGDFERIGNHSVRGPQTVREILEKAVSHFEHHLGFVVEKVRVLRDAR